MVVYRKSRQPVEKAPETERPREAFKLTDQYLALLLLVLTDAGLLDVSHVAHDEENLDLDTTLGAYRNARRIDERVYLISESHSTHG